VSLRAALATYLDHPDSATRLGNGVAVLVGGNAPFYPLYVWLVLPDAGRAALATMVAGPLFLAIPWIARRRAGWARAALPLLGIANTLWTAALLGPATGVFVFLYPCILLAALSWRAPIMLSLIAGSGFAALFAAQNWPLPPVAGLEPIAQGRLADLNATSVAALMCYLVFSGARHLRTAAA